MQSPVPAPLLGKPGSGYDPAADEGEGLLASLGHSLARVVQEVGLDEEGEELPLELTVSTNKAHKTLLAPHLKICCGWVEGLFYIM